MSLYRKSFLYLDQMRKPGMILILIALAGVCASQVEVDLTLSNSNVPLRVTVPEGAFQMIDKQRDIALAPLGTENNGSISKKTPAKRYTPAAWCSFENEFEYEQFRQLWGTNLSTLSAECSALLQEQISLTADLFNKCLVTANYLDIRGEYAKRFFTNMVKYGLFGAHSADIVSSEAFSNYDLSHDTSRDLLYAFLDQIGFEYRTTHPSTGQIMLRIESTDAQVKKINKEYTGPSQTAKMRTVLYTELGPPSSQEKERNEAVLGWLLLNIEGSSVDIHYAINITSEDSTELSQTIESLTKENKKGIRVYVEGLTLSFDYSSIASLLPAFQRVPNLSRLKTAITSASRSNTELSSLFSSITSCKSLKALKITGRQLETAFVRYLARNFPNIEQLSLWCRSLEDSVAEDFKECTHLISLSIYKKPQTSRFVQKIAESLPLLRDLDIFCFDLEPIAVGSFQRCPCLERLNICGAFQSSDIVQQLAQTLPSLKELSILCDTLHPTAAKSFEACSQITKLNIGGMPQTSATVQELVTHLPLLKELNIVCASLHPSTADIFKTSSQLTKLIMHGECQSSASFLVKILKCLLHLQELRIEIDSADLALATVFRACPNLCSLVLRARRYTPGFLACYLQDPFPSLASLEFYKLDKNNKYSKEDYNAVERAHMKNMSIVQR